ncbi:MAG: hypothetical protein WCH43_00550 [Verrucomicrobiota bacterium]
MPWHTILLEDLPVIETRYSGVLTPAELSSAAREIFDLIREHNRTFLLADCTALGGGHSIVDLYALAETLASGNLVPNLKEAVLLPSLPDSVENVKFWETACINRGIRVRIFCNRQSALDWLMT